MTYSGAVMPVSDRDHVLGAKEPELTLIEYGDFGCRFCFAASRGVSSLLERYATLRLVWRHLPDPQLHPGADLAAELSELAATQGRFWAAHSLLLTGREQFSCGDLLAVAGRLGLDLDEAESALREHRFRERVLEDLAGGRRAGVHATPTFFLGSEPLQCAWRRLPQIVAAMLGKDAEQRRIRSRNC
jgi:protein-disulfide isomerase